METEEEENINHKNDEYIHFHKINIIGDKGVGKSSFISYLKNYSDKDFTIEKELENNISIESFDDNKLLVEDIYRYTINFNEDRNLYFNIYETNLNNFEFIKNNLEALLFQSECIIIMWDISRPETFDNIPNLINGITFINKKNNVEVPIFIIQNKKDLKLEESIKSGKSVKSVKSVTEIELNKKIEEYKKMKNIIYKDVSLLYKDEFYDLILQLYQAMGISEKDKKDGNNYLNFDVFDVKFKHPIQDLNNENNNKTEIGNSIDCLLLGYESVGKKSFINILLEKDISDKSSNQDLYIFSSEINNEKYFLKINRIKEQENKLMIKSLYKKTYIFLLFFDVTNMESFDEATKLLHTIIDEKGNNDNYNILLIGNKIDDNENRLVKDRTAKKLAEDNNNTRYIECSCSMKINVFEILNEITIIAYRKSFNKDNKSIKIKKTNFKNKGKGCC